VTPPPLRTISFEGYLETLTAAERGLGIAYGLFPMTSEWVRAGRLSVPLKLRYALDGGVFLVFRENDPRHALLTEVAQWMREEYAGLPELPEGRIVHERRQRRAR
jgi:DNA-binding transcriptional LysR family regulator